MREKIGIIGYGNMGSAIAERIKSKYQILVFDKDKEKTRNLAGISVADNIVDLVDKVETVILAVKPQDFASVLGEIKEYIKDRLIISIAAGITTGYIEKYLKQARIVRAMPNLPARIGAAMTCLSKGKSATNEDFDFAESLFTYLGKTMQLDEKLMSAVTAISGSGPAYICQYLELKGCSVNNTQRKFWDNFKDNFKQIAINLGFKPQEAEILVSHTIAGTVRVLKERKISPQELKRQVTSKGGTTEAALEVWQKTGSFIEAVKAAKKRAEELSK